MFSRIAIIIMLLIAANALTQSDPTFFNPRIVADFAEKKTASPQILEKAEAALKKVADAASEQDSKLLEVNKSLLPRLKSGVVVKRKDVLIPDSKDVPVNFPSEASKQKTIGDCEAAIKAGEERIDSYKNGDFSAYARTLTMAEGGGEIGTLPGKSVTTIHIINKHTVYGKVEWKTPPVEIPKKKKDVKSPSEITHARHVFISGPSTADARKDVKTACDDLFISIGELDFNGAKSTILVPYKGKK